MPAQNIKKYSLYTIYVSLVVGITLTSFGAVSSYVDTKRRETSYEQLPMSLKLKAPAENVIHSEILTTPEGEETVRYAYTENEVVSIENEDVSRRTPNSQTVVLGKTQEGNKTLEKLTTTFYAKPQLYLDKEGKWRQIEYATTTPETFALSGAIPHIKNRELFERITGATPVFAGTATYYPDPHTETTSVDGVSNLYLGDWALAQGGVTGTSVDDLGTTISVYVEDGIDGSFNPFVSITRAFTLFDTSGLPDDSAIASATMSVYATAKNNTDNDGTDTLNLVTSTPASNTTIVAADYDQLGTTLQADAIDITSVTTSAYNVFTLNATGIGTISKTSITKFGLREGHDLGNSPISVLTVNSVTMSSADNTGTTQDPKLDVTYSVPTFSTGDWFPF